MGREFRPLIYVAPNFFAQRAAAHPGIKPVGRGQNPLILIRG